MSEGSNKNPAASSALVHQYDKSLGQMQKWLSTPLVAGEMPEWVGGLLHATKETTASRDAVREQVIAKEYEQIAQTDPAHAPAVKELQEEDIRISERLRQLTVRLESLNQRAKRLEPDEAPLIEEVNDVLHEGLESVLTMQKQETARRTWLQESHNRERGAGD